MFDPQCCKATEKSEEIVLNLLIVCRVAEKIAGNKAQRKRQGPRCLKMLFTFYLVHVGT